MYSPQLLDHFEHPRNAGEVPAAAACVEVANPACGDVLRLSANLEGDVIREIGFLAKGCVPAMACGSALAELVEGRSLAETAIITREDILVAVGGVPTASGHAVQLALDALAALLGALRARRSQTSLSGLAKASPVPVPENRSASR